MVASILGVILQYMVSACFSCQFLQVCGKGLKDEALKRVKIESFEVVFSQTNLAVWVRRS